jgi:hypothetical protein
MEGDGKKLFNDKETSFMLNTPPVFNIVLSDFLFYNYFQSAILFSTIKKTSKHILIVTFLNV